MSSVQTKQPLAFVRHTNASQFFSTNSRLVVTSSTGGTGGGAASMPTLLTGSGVSGMVGIATINHPRTLELTKMEKFCSHL